MNDIYLEEPSDNVRITEVDIDEITMIEKLRSKIKEKKEVLAWEIFYSLQSGDKICSKVLKRKQNMLDKYNKKLEEYEQQINDLEFLLV